MYKAASKLINVIRWFSNGFTSIKYLRTIPLQVHIRILSRNPIYHIKLLNTFHRRIDFSPMPFYLSIETTRMCNLRCIMCEHTYIFANDNSYIDIQTFYNILNNIPRVAGINLTGLGEPLLNPDFIDIVKAAKSRKLYVEFFTNGVLLDESVGKCLIDLGVDRVVFSLDAATEATYRKIRGADYFIKVLSNLINLINLRNNSDSNTFIAVNFVLSTVNNRELYKFVELMQAIGVDEVIINPVIPPKIFLKSLTQDKPTINLKLPVNISPYMRRIGKLCPLPWTAPFISCEGYVFPCCFISEFGKYKQLLATGGLGNILESSFKEIWCGVRYRMVRHEMLKLGTSYMCRGCTMTS
ncbi:MAG: radical SAM protein [Candidatus Methanomethylicia archaeon]